MSKPFIDIADVNCWIIYIMPFPKDERTNYGLVDNLQKKCIEDKVFGMGWDLDCFDYGTQISNEKEKEYADNYFSQNKERVSDDALNAYLEIKKGDYVIFRRKNGHYYVGRVSSERSFYLHKGNDEIYRRFSWGGAVEEWIEYSNDSELPSEIVGRFSQRLHSTIQKISPYRQRMLVIAMYENKTGNRNFAIPKLIIGKNNFVRSMYYKELEDLVALFIMERHSKEGYKLMPSSCKVSQQNYEFMFLAKDKKPITCQVKNQKEIENIDVYAAEKSYENIYLFSGLWNDEKIKKLKEEYSKYKHLYFISQSELYETLKEDWIISNDFYDYNNCPMNPSNLKLQNYTELKKTNGENTYSIDEDFACFIKKTDFFYSSEFDAFVLSRHIFDDDREYEKKCIEKVLRDIG